MRDWLRQWAPIGAVVIASVLLYRWVEPPPRTVRIATGSEEGAYTAFARRYRDILARDGIALEIVTTAGSLENLRLLTDPAGRADVAFLQGGTRPPDGATGLVAIASVFLEPVWLFVRSDLAVTHLADLRGRRLAVGAEGSGTRAIALELLGANQLTAPSTDYLPIGWRDAIDALLARRVDAAFFVTARPLPTLDDLLRSPRVRLLSAAQADAYTRRYRFLSRVVLPEGGLDLAANLPPRDITLVAPAAALIARETLHAAIVERLFRAARQVHAAGHLFEEPGQFPSPRYVDFPLSDESDRLFKSGPSFLSRHLPFWAAVTAERLLLTLVPVVTLLIPFFGLAPRLVGWRERHRIARLHWRIHGLDDQARGARTPDDIQRIQRELETVEDAMSAVVTPGHAESLYHLRQHALSVRQRLERSSLPARG